MSRHLATSLPLLALASLLGTAGAQDAYRITDLGDLPGNFGASATAINESGEVVGFSFGIPGTQSWVWDETHLIQNIGALAGAQSIWAQDINDAGVVAGYTDGGITEAFARLTPGGPVESLGVIAGDFFSAGFGVNNSNQIVGNSSSGAMIWDDDGNGMQPLVDTLGGLPLASAADISDGGTVVGLSANQRAFVMLPGQAAVELGVLEPFHDQSFAFAVNDANQVIGTSGAGGSTGRGWFWEPGGSLMDVGSTDPTHDLIQPLGINNLGEVVGFSVGPVPGTVGDAFLWTEAEGIRALNDLIDPSDPLVNEVELTRGIDINDAGQIVVDGLRSGQARAFLLTPTTIGELPSALEVSFDGPIIEVDDVTGTGTYADVQLDDLMSGVFYVGETATGSSFVPPATYEFPTDAFYGVITDGVTETSTRDSARSLEISLRDDVAADADTIALINDILGTSLPPGTPFDAYEIETDISGVGTRLEFGISYVSLDTGFITDTDYRPPPALSEVDLAIYFVVEEQGPTEVYNALGLIAAQSIVLPQDSDADGVPDYRDNCIFVSNGPLTPAIGANAQRDTDADLYGNVCDPDLNNDLIVNAIDLGLFKARFFTSDPDADFTGDGIVNVTDLGILKLYFFMPPGPSGLAP